MSKDSGAGFFTGLLVGALIGVVVGFMYAPKSGTETRRIVKEKVANLREGASGVAGKVKGAVQSRMAREEE
ncbi:MAG: YtxH domain-containing protein [Dehalococcoidia bacterium]